MFSPDSSGWWMIVSGAATAAAAMVALFLLSVAGWALAFKFRQRRLGARIRRAAPPPPELSESLSADLARPARRRHGALPRE